jgi:hypothetical protein
MFVWMAVEWSRRRKPSGIGIASGAVRPRRDRAALAFPAPAAPDKHLSGLRAW